MAMSCARLIACSMRSVRTSSVLANGVNRPQQPSRPDFPSFASRPPSNALSQQRCRSAKAAAVPAESVLTSDNIAPPVNETNQNAKHDAPRESGQQVAVAVEPARANVQKLDPPTPDGSATRTFSPKIQKLVDDIAKLTLIEVSQLNELMKKTFNIPDQPMMPAGMMAAMQPKAGGDAGEEAGDDSGKKKVEQTAFTVKLTKFDEAKKIALIKEIKNSVEGLNLVQAKKFVESAPQIVKADLAKDAAEKLKVALEAAGATITIE